MINDWEHSAIPASGRWPLYSVAAVWINFVFVPVFINFAFALGRTMPAGELLAAFVVGGCILALCSTVSGIIGQRTGLSAGLLISYIFGRNAGRSIALAVALLLIGWDSFVLDLIGTELVKIFGYPEYRGAYILSSMAVFALTAAGGFRWLARMSIITIPVMMGLMSYALYVAAKTHGGFAYPPHATPATSFSTAVTQTVGLFALGSIMCSPDIQRFCKTTKDASIVGAVTFVFALPFLLIVGGLTALLTDSPSLMTSFRALDLLWPGFAAFMLLSWSCCDNDYYSAGLSVAAISGIDKVWLVPPLAAAAASIAILGIGDYLLPWLVFMTTISIPIAGVIIADFFILKRNVDVPVTEAIRLPAVLSWCLGAAASYFSTLAHLGIPPLQGILVACLSQVCLSRIPLLNPKIS